MNAATTSCYQLSISFRSSSLLTGDDESNDGKLHTDSSCVVFSMFSEAAGV